MHDRLLLALSFRFCPFCFPCLLVSFGIKLGRFTSILSSICLVHLSNGDIQRSNLWVGNILMLFISHSSTALCLIKLSALIFDTRSVKGLWQQWGSSHGAAATRSATASLGITFHSNSIAVCNHCESDRDHDVRSGLCCGSCGVCRASDPTSSTSRQSRLRCRRRRRSVRMYLFELKKSWDNQGK